MGDGLRAHFCLHASVLPRAQCRNLLVLGEDTDALQQANCVFNGFGFGCLRRLFQELLYAVAGHKDPRLQTEILKRDTQQLGPLELCKQRLAMLHDRQNTA